jgi:hypothetical protein
MSNPGSQLMFAFPQTGDNIIATGKTKICDAKLMHVSWVCVKASCNEPRK